MMMSEKQWTYRTGGIPDELFERGRVPMTKSEVRAVTIAKARLADRHVIWDIGAGTGSITIEAALAATGGQVFAIEKNDEAVALLHKNTDMFETANVTICYGTAPEALHGLPGPDRVFVGGSGGNLRDIIEFVHCILPVGGRIVINAVVFENLITAFECLKQLKFDDVEVTQVSIAKTTDVGGINMFRSNTPVFVLSGEKS